MFETLASKIRAIMSLPDLRKKVIFTIIMCAVARVGTHIPAPGINADALKIGDNSILGMMNMFSGGAFAKVSIFALGVMPYINASIVMQLLTVIVPQLEEIKKDGDAGQQKIIQWTRYVTIGVAIIQGIGMSFWLNSQPGLVVMESFVLFTIILVTVLTAGTVFLMWLGEQITVNGIGNGISLLIFIGIVSRIPQATLQMLDKMKGDKVVLVQGVFVLVVAVVVIGIIVLFQLGKRKIPIIYVGKGFSGKGAVGSQQYIPLKINTAGVMPIIFASVIMMLPNLVVQALGQIMDKSSKAYLIITKLFEQTSPLYIILYVGCVLFFAFFYTALMFDPEKVAENLKKGGGSVPGIRPGVETVDYLERVVTRITWIGAVFLSLLAVMPIIVFDMMNMPIYLGGTGLLIVVGVALDFVQQVNAHLVMRDYEGFID
jgi:preprotein translocase subunit SecY